jgi:LemA protein
MVRLDETVTEKWSNVESQYQRRSDLIPNLVATVKGYAEHEKETLEGVMKARASATQINVDPTKLTPETIKAYSAAQGQVSQALGRLLAVSERYPDLKANQNFLELQAQLEGTENRIAVARNRFNEAVKDYNTKIRSFPGVIYAGWFGFEKKTPFEADASAKDAPKVQF